MQKHRLWTGDVENHLEVVSIEPIDEEELVLSDRKEIGEGENAYLVTVGFIGNDEKAYEYVIYSDEEPSEDEIKHEVAHSLETRSTN